MSRGHTSRVIGDRLLELLCVRVITTSSCVIAVIYHSGFEFETAAMIGWISSLSLSTQCFLVGDVNYQLERATVHVTSQSTWLLAAYCLICHTMNVMHHLGGTLHIVVIHEDLPLSVIDTFNVSLSDHY